MDRQPKLLPDDVGKEPKDGKECIRVIHTEELGNKAHIQNVRPIRLTMGDFLKLYSTDNKAITVFDNMNGVPTEQLITLGDYDPRYSYYSENYIIQKIRDLLKYRAHFQCLHSPMTWL